jgi:hypothetical protein
MTISATQLHTETACSSKPTEGQFFSDVPIRHPGEHDLLLGRGGGTNNHSGNIKFRRLVNEHKLRYMFCPKLEKPKVARDVVALWRALSPPGRFLSCPEMKRGPGSVKDCENEWFEVGDRKAREKASQCLRERTPNIAPFLRRLRLHQDAFTEDSIAMVQQQIAIHNCNGEQAGRAFGNSRGPEHVTQHVLFNQQCIDSGEQQMFEHYSSAPSCNEGHGLVAPAYSSYLVEDATYSSSAPAPAAEPCGNSGYSPCTPGAQRGISMPGMMMTSFVSSNNVALSPQGAANACRRAAAAGVALLPEEAAYLHAAETGTPRSLQQTSSFLSSSNISVGSSLLAYNTDPPRVLSSTIVSPPFTDSDEAVPLLGSSQSFAGAEEGRKIGAPQQQETSKMELLSQQHQLGQQEKFSKRKKSPASFKKLDMANPRSKNAPKNNEATENAGADGSQEIRRNGLASSQQTNAAASAIIPPHSAETVPRPPRRNAASPKKKSTRNLSEDLRNRASVSTSSKLSSSKCTAEADKSSSFDALTVNTLISAAALTTNGAGAIYQQQLWKYVTEMTRADPSLDDDSGTFDESYLAEVLSDLDDDDGDDWEEEYEELNRRRERQGSGGNDGGEQLKRGVDRHWSGISCLTEMSGVSLSLKLDRCVFTGQHFSPTPSLAGSELNVTKGHDGSKVDGSDVCPSRPTGSNHSTTSEMTELSNFVDTLG